MSLTKSSFWHIDEATQLLPHHPQSSISGRKAMQLSQFVAAALQLNSLTENKALESVSLATKWQLCLI